MQDIPPTPRTLISEIQPGVEQTQVRPPTSDDKSKKSTAKNTKSDKKSESNPATVILFLALVSFS
jgi:hypothetical protein